MTHDKDVLAEIMDTIRPGLAQQLAVYEKPEEPPPVSELPKTGVVRTLIAEFLKEMQTPELLFFGQQWYIHQAAQGWLSTEAKTVEAGIARYVLACQRVDFSQKIVADILTGLRGALHAPDTGEHFAYFIRRGADGCIRQLEPADGWLACENVLLHTPTGKTLPFTTELFTPGRVPCVYDPTAECPRWLQFLHEVAPEETANLQMMAGLSLSYDRRYNVFFVLHGEGGTGKSTFLNILQTLNAGAFCNISLSDFGERFHYYDLTTKRVNIVHDMDSIYDTGNVSIREARLKSACCGEGIHAERKNEQGGTRRLIALNLFACNNFPRFSDRSTAIPSRMRVIGFHRPFRDTIAQDHDLGEKLLAELPGIFRWAVEGYQALIQSGAKTFPESETSRELKSAHLKKSRPEIEFFEEFTEKDESVTWQPSLEIYTAYKNFCWERGYKPMNQAGFNAALEKYHNISPPVQRQQAGKRSKAYSGIRLLKPEESPDNF